MKKLHALRTSAIVLLLVSTSDNSNVQHTFSLLAIDTITREIGSAWAICIDIDNLRGDEGILVIIDLIKIQVFNI
jgi:hypothetical protein